MPETDIIVWMFVVMIFSLVWTMLTPQLMTLQARMGLGQIRKSVRQFEGWARESRQVALRAILKHGKPKRDVEKEFDNFLEFFDIEPVSEDPVGVLRRLEHVLDVRKRRFQGAVARFAPKADSESAANLEMAIEGAMANRTLYRLMRHYMLLAEKTKNMQLVMLVQMNIPFLREYGRSFVEATKAFVEGKPIGDGVGPLTAAKFIGEAKCRELVEDTVYAETRFDGRKLLVVKARGPGGRVGKPGELIKRLIQKYRVSRIIMIDAAGKLEGEASGEVVEGVGAAIGGPPTEKYKIEEIATKRRVPVDAIVVKESFAEAIKPMNKRLARGAEIAAERVKKAIRERTKPGDTVIIAGIGNTIGIGQMPGEIPTEFPSPPAREKDELESVALPMR
ncbi:TPA: DUF1512 domain-containing protein [Candidatus Poribacteria bacterium]|nr:DUF1512 domain-containing protein [Candidatus Poribacteria bacterium]HEX30440.1 DUF1512 domain-containing protein [Candidatus Poribacteria bacterium]